MSQQIINIPVNWDDELFTRVVEKGVVEEVKNKISEKSLDRLGLNRSYGYSFWKGEERCYLEINKKI